MSEPTTQNELQEAQLRQIQLATEKLAIELNEHRKGRVWQNLIPLVTTAITILTFCIGIYRYSVEQSNNRVASQKALNKERMAPWLASQREVYNEALTAAATVANSEDPKQRSEAWVRFQQFFHGPMILVETSDVASAMSTVRGYLDPGNRFSREEMNRQCRALGTSMARSMAESAKMTVEEFAAHQAQYVFSMDESAPSPPGEKKSPTDGTGPAPYLNGPYRPQ